MGLGGFRDFHFPLLKLKEVRISFSGFCLGLATRQPRGNGSGTFLLREGTPSAMVLSNEGTVMSSVAFSPDFSWGKDLGYVLLCLTFLWFFWLSEPGSIAFKMISGIDPVNCFLLDI